MWYFTNPPKCFCNQAKITPLWQFLALCKWWGHTWTKCTQRQGFFTFFLILLGPLEATGEVLSWGLWLWEWMDWQSKGRKRGKENCLERRGGRGGSRGLGDEREKKGRRGIPPTKPVVERFWGLDCPQETVVAPSQASHQAALGHPVINRQTYQMAWMLNRQGFVYFSCFGGGGEIVQRKLFIRALICHVSAFARGECVYISLACV